MANKTRSVTGAAAARREAREKREATEQARAAVATAAPAPNAHAGRASPAAAAKEAKENVASEISAQPNARATLDALDSGNGKPKPVLSPHSWLLSVLGSGARDGAAAKAAAQHAAAAMDASSARDSLDALFAEPHAHTGGSNKAPTPATVMGGREMGSAVPATAAAHADAAAMPPPAALPAAAHSVGGLAHTVGGGVVGVGPHGGAVSRLDDSARGDGAHAHPARRLGMDTAFQSAVFGGGMVSGAAHAVPGGHDGVGLSRGALLSSAGDRSPDGLAPTRLLFSPLTEARKRRSGFEPDPESAPSLSSARKLLAGDAPWMSPGETARRGSRSAGVFMHQRVTDHSLAGQPPAPRAAPPPRRRRRRSRVRAQGPLSGVHHRPHRGRV